LERVELLRQKVFPVVDYEVEVLQAITAFGSFALLRSEVGDG
jgi:hypothetical protein